MIPVAESGQNVTRHSTHPGNPGYKGMNDLKASNLAPTRTVEALKRDAHMVKEQVQ